MAALRHAARKLIGGVQRPPAISTAVLSPPAADPRRLVHVSSWTTLHKISKTQMSNPPGATTRSLASSSSELPPNNHWSASNSEYCFDTAKAQIRDKKEELYNQLAEVESKNAYLKRINEPGKKQIRELLEHIAKHVQPKPDDRTWRTYRRLKRWSDWDRKLATLLVYVGLPAIIYTWRDDRIFDIGS